MNTDKFLNFVGDSQDYKFHGPLPNPFGLRGNPDTQANSSDQGDGLNGTPDYRGFTGDVQDGGWSNHPGFIGINWGGGGNNTPVGDSEPADATYDPNPITPTTTSGGGFISGLFGGNGMKTYYSCQGGVPVGSQHKRGEQPAGFSSNQNTVCLTQQEKDQKKKNTWNNIGSILDSLNKGYQTGINSGKPNTTPQFDPNLNPTGTTTTTTNAGLGDTSKILGWVLVAGVVFALGYMAIKSTSRPRPEFYND